MKKSNDSKLIKKLKQNELLMPILPTELVNLIYDFVQVVYYPFIICVNRQMFVICFVLFYFIYCEKKIFSPFVFYN